MKNKSSSRKPRLNKKQRAWVNSFLSSHPNARVRTIYELDGDRVVQIEWWENTTPVILDPKSYIQGIISYNMWVKLRKSGDPRKTAEFSYRITPPEKRSASWHLTGQLSLELPQCYEVAEPNNPVIVKLKRRNTKTKKGKDSGGRVLTKGTLEEEYHKYEPKPASRIRQRKLEPVTDRKTGRNNY